MKGLTVYYIYCLLDPRDMTPFYLGRTRNPKQRRRAHLNPASWDKQSPAYAAKMRELKSIGDAPYFGLLESTYDSAREAHHIVNLLKMGYGLTNRNTKTGFVAGYRSGRPKTTPAERKAIRVARSAAIAATLPWRLSKAGKV